MGLKKITVSREEAMKYANVSWYGSGPDAKAVATIFTDNDGNIDEESTYSITYRQQLKQGNQKERNENSSSKANNKNTSKGQSNNSKNGCCLLRIFLAPFKLLWWLIKSIF